MQKTDELRMRRIDRLVAPATLAAALPVSAAMAENVLRVRQRIERILHGEDPRLLVIIGPCSIHDTDAALEYARRLNPLRVKYQERLEIVMRTYFEKPRTVVGWKGLIADPGLDGSFRVNEGLEVARRLLLAVNKLGLPTATEFLDMVTGQHIADLISWGAIGARTTESQIHREMASALSCPVGFKNGTDGNIQIAIDAIRAARVSHLFLSPDKQGQMMIYQTGGNPYGHIIMRGGKVPNYQPQAIEDACAQLASFGLPAHLLVDFSHGNSQRQYLRQLDVAHAVCQPLRGGSRQVVGIMAESNLVAGNQGLGADTPLVYGQSITDACLGWEDSERLLAMLSDAVNCRF
ncbi:phospho-2-dehydro-3-deoxyheptonate aldolase [Sodalis-like endosymbiont of Proechinophthirus fluctus]|uniref:3-deoxy-7-phosphoheptulonate synthase n=1 Tax=Sodalis-like endosymbiont of Proechinophthirus fluctus TaxID=1462730 RepID=UPI0007A829BC|nr:3-deoxy-7-phosphoheptulonate synthase [Sodalis-like endosymbiont of Proechinophthirus fluctus]KYP97475.1 phospho-2-dehydro-3-deoxyheptonate aldolase [Sodalis-like endosymbiont of Proechinophthirus fluctus]